MTGLWAGAGHSGTGTATSVSGGQFGAWRTTGTVTYAKGLWSSADDGINSYGIQTFANKTSAITTAGTAYGGWFHANNAAVTTTGTDSTYGIYSKLKRTGATGGTINSYGAYIDIDTLDTAGSGTHTAYGLYLDDVTGADTNYQIYSNGTAPSYFAGPVGMGIATSPQYALDVRLYPNNSSGVETAAYIENYWKGSTGLPFAGVGVRGQLVLAGSSDAWAFGNGGPPLITAGEFQVSHERSGNVSPATGILTSMSATGGTIINGRNIFVSDGSGNITNLAGI
ncbi:hypothetical protein ACFLZO_01395, partial [Patescibacteria group bacterium]